MQNCELGEEKPRTLALGVFSRQLNSSSGMKRQIFVHPQDLALPGPPFHLEEAASQALVQRPANRRDLVFDRKPTKLSIGFQI